MEACGVIVEYNPFHNGHLYHLKQAKKVSKANCIIAIMSGSFLQRGEPAIIDKFHRTKAALSAGADMVVELPYPFAVQSSALFAKGALYTLNELHVSSICFGSESGKIEPFINSVTKLQENKSLYDETLRSFLEQGFAFPEASSKAYNAIGMNSMDMIQPNNILGLSYVKTIIENNLPIKPLTTKRINNHYHDEKITNEIASATSIRKELSKTGISSKITDTLPAESLIQLQTYIDKSTLWHSWEHYFPLLHYRVMTMTKEELSNIHGVTEGLEHRIRKTAEKAISFHDWLEKIKTKRYTKVRLQRIFVHILTNTTKKAIASIVQTEKIPYIRLLGMSKKGQAYLNANKKNIDVPIITNLNKQTRTLLYLDEKATHVYYSVLPAKLRSQLRTQEFKLPIFYEACSLGSSCFK